MRKLTSALSTSDWLPPYAVAFALIACEDVILYRFLALDSRGSALLSFIKSGYRFLLSSCFSASLMKLNLPRHPRIFGILSVRMNG